jgi:tripartite ATP-independent transporter DctM subunit
MSIEHVVIILVVTALAVFVTGLPIGFALGSVALIYALFLWGPSSLGIAAIAAMSSMQPFIFVALPLFILMGMILERSGVGKAMYDTLYKWMGGLNGGLAIGSVIMCTLIAAMVGIMGAGIVTAGVVAMPEMFRRQYDKRMVMGAIMSGGVLGTLIPPSIPMILYSLYARQSVGKMFAGGLIPGLILSALYCTYIGIRCYLNPKMGPALPPEERVGLKEKAVSLRGSILPILLIVAVLGSIFTGAATPTEAAAVGAFGAFLCSVIYRTFSGSMLKEACYRTTRLMGMILWIMVGIGCFNSFFMGMGGAHLVEGLIVGVSPWAVLIGMQLSLFIMGMFLDDYAIIMICTPIYAPVIALLGFDPLWFGILFIMNMQMAVLTPPYGFATFYMRALAPKDILMTDIWRAVIPFVGLQAIGLVIVMIFPQLTLWLPHLIFK